MKRVEFDEKINFEIYNKEMRYFKDYYGSDYFRSNQGTENILNMIHEYSIAGDWIDLGAGSNTYFWGSAFKKIKSITCVDLIKEPFYITEKIKRGEISSKCFEHVYSQYGIDSKQIYSLPIHYYTADLLNADKIEFHKKYHNVSQFGLLGLSASREVFNINIEKLIEFVREEGVFFGANWIFSEELSEKRSFTNEYLDEDVIVEFSKRKKLSLIYLEKVKILNDVNYSNVILYALKKGSKN